MGLIHVGPVIRRRNGTYDDPASSRRQGSVVYSVPNGTGDLIRVCKSTFMNVFALGRKRVDILIKKKKMGEMTFKDKRTRHARGKYEEEERNRVKNHINSFPREVSHYTRARSNKEYLSPVLNINRLHCHFKKMFPQTRVTYMFYRSIFLKEFPHLAFQRPRKDTCKTCDLLNIEAKGGSSDSRNSKMKLELHHRKAQQAQNLTKTDISASQLSDSKTCCIAIDL